MTAIRPQIVFSKRDVGMPMPDLLDIQTQAFKSLLVPDDVHGERQDVSLERVFRDLFPISDVAGKYSLEFISYSLGETKYSVEEQTEFTVVLKTGGEKKIQVIKAVRELTSLGLKEAKDLVDNGGTIKEGVSKAEANEMKKKLEDQGATVELK